MSATACSACGTANPAGARFCNGCGARLEAALVAESRRTVTVVFVDVAGSTALGERLDPESLRALIGEFFELARSVVERHGGVVEKFIGDAVMAVFGLPTLHEDDALRAVRAAAELRDRHAASTLADRLAIRIGVNTGEVVAGDPAAGQRLVTGDAVNTAARLEQAAPVGSILLGVATLRLVRDAVRVTELEAIDARGKSEPVRAFRLDAVQPDAEATQRHLDAPLIGRERELARLVRSYDDAVAERRCGLFTLLGPAGVGKSRLVHEFLARVRSEATVLRGRSLPYGEGITYWPVAEMVRSIAGIDETADRTEARDRLARLVAGAPDGAELADRVGRAIGVVDGQVDRDDVFRAVRRLFETLAADRPLVAVFDDLQWAEPTLIDLVEHVVDWSRGAPILVVVLARPELLDARPGWGGGKLDAQTVLLEGLGDGETRRLAASLLGGEEVHGPLLDRIEAVAEGNPLFVEQLVAMLVEDGALIREDGRWRVAADLAALRVPPTISALLAARLDGLPVAERAVAARASVMGRVFERVAVAELSPETERADVALRLRQLVRRELIRPDPSSPQPDETFRFRHILIRDAAYEALPKRDRAELHARFADWLEATTGGRLAEYEEIVGYHLAEAVGYRLELGLDDAVTAELRERSFARLSEAARRALDRTDPQAAANLLQRAVELARGTTIVYLDELLDLGTAHLELSRFDDASAALSEARTAAEAAGDSARSARAQLLAASVRLASDPSVSAEDVERLVASVLPTLEQHGYVRGLIDAWIARGQAALTRSRWTEVTAAYERALAYAEDARAGWLSDLILTWLANALVWGPTDAVTGMRRCGELFDRVRSRRAGAVTETALAVLAAYAGRLDEARAHLSDARATLSDLGLDRILLGSNLRAAEIENAAGEWQRAAELLAAGREAMTALGETGVRSTVEGHGSFILARLGREEEALEWSAASERNAAPDDMASQMSFRAGRALALAHRGELDEALRLSADACALGEQTDQLNETGEMFAIRGEVLRLAGRRDEARRALERAAELFRGKGNTLATDRAEDALRALG